MKAPPKSTVAVMVEKGGKSKPDVASPIDSIAAHFNASQSRGPA